MFTVPRVGSPRTAQENVLESQRKARQSTSAQIPTLDRRSRRDTRHAGEGLLMEDPPRETGAVSEDKSHEDQSDHVQISDAYLTEFAKKFARRTLSEQTAKDQRACLASCSVFLLGWFRAYPVDTQAYNR